MGIFDRIKEERLRLGLSQEQLGAIAGVRKQAQLMYEKGDRNPDTLYLAAIAEAGADVLYILTGQRNQSMLSADEQHLITLFRAASLPVKMAAVGALQGAASMRHEMHNAGHGAIQIGTVSGSGKVRVGKTRGKN